MPRMLATRAQGILTRLQMVIGKETTWMPAAGSAGMEVGGFRCPVNEVLALD